MDKYTSILSQLRVLMELLYQWQTQPVMIHNTKSLVWIQVGVLSNSEFKNISQIVLLKGYLPHIWILCREQCPSATKVYTLSSEYYIVYICHWASITLQTPHTVIHNNTELENCKSVDTASKQAWHFWASKIRITQWTTRERIDLLCPVFTLKYASIYML